MPSKVDEIFALSNKIKGFVEAKHYNGQCYYLKFDTCKNKELKGQFKKKCPWASQSEWDEAENDCDGYDEFEKGDA